MRIVLCYPVEPRHVEQIAHIATQAQVVDAGQERIGTEILDADIFCGHAKVPVPWDDVVSRGRLRWIQSSAAGLDHCLVPSVVASNITVTSASGVLADQVAEHAIGLATALSRSLPVFLRAQQKREFIRRPTSDLHHSTVGIIGFGGVGRRIAELLAPYRTRIVATDLFPIDRPPHVAELWPAERLDDVLEIADFLLLAVPLTPLTEQMMTADRFARMKPGAYFLNLARGKLIEESALVAALDSKHLAGAALDVTPTEPLAADSPLWSAPNLIITPHVAGQSARRIDDMTDFFCDNLGRYLTGAPLKNLVDKNLGFPRRLPA
ncbi:MAG: D-2-hydroxyacid dehydrogenase [Pirellulales bacterium]|nr:D-2-hydroxyacid dehydrogenase [Pirellulales bacterium]